MTDWYKIKRVLTWVNWEEKQIYPAIKVLEYDFTTDYHWFSYYNKNSSPFSYGRDSNWLYIYYWTSWYWMVAWSMPSSLYTTQWVLQKIELKQYSTASWNWLWICNSAADNANLVLRVWSSVIEKKINTSSWSSTSVTVPTDYTFTIDLVNKETYISTSPSTKFALTDSEVTYIRDTFTNWNLRLCNMRYASGTYSYLQNAKFYIK